MHGGGGHHGGGGFGGGGGHHGGGFGGGGGGGHHGGGFGGGGGWHHGGGYAGHSTHVTHTGVGHAMGRPRAATYPAGNRWAGVHGHGPGFGGGWQHGWAHHGWGHGWGGWGWGRWGWGLGRWGIGWPAMFWGGPFWSPFWAWRAPFWLPPVVIYNGSASPPPPVVVQVNADQVPVYEQRDLATVVASYKAQTAAELSIGAGETVKIIGYDPSGWCRVQYHGIEGFFPANHLHIQKAVPAAGAPPATTATMQAAPAGTVGKVVRSHQAQTGTELSVAAGQMVAVRGFDPSGWLRVVSGEQEGWIPDQCVEPVGGERGEAAPVPPESTATMQRAPAGSKGKMTVTFTAHSKRELSVDKDTLVDGFDPATGWLYVRKPGHFLSLSKEGWVPAVAVEPVLSEQAPPTPAANAPASTAHAFPVPERSLCRVVQAHQAASAGELTVQPGETGTVKGFDPSGWVRAVFSGREGWVPATCVEPHSAEETPPPGYAPPPYTAGANPQQNLRRVLQTYVANSATEISANFGDVVELLQLHPSGWAYIRLASGKCGYFPPTFLHAL